MAVRVLIATLCFAAMTACDRGAPPAVAPSDEESTERWQTELARINAIRLKFEASPFPDATRQALALANNDQTRGIALGHLQRSAEALAAFASARDALHAEWEKLGCEGLSAPTDCRDIARLRTLTHSLRAMRLNEMGEHAESRAALRDAVVTSRTTDTFERSLATYLAFTIAADAFEEGADLLAGEIESAHRSRQRERLHTARKATSSFIRSMVFGVSWTKEGSMRGNDPRDFVDNTGIGIGRQIKYGMTDRFEDDSTFFTAMVLEEMVASRKYSSDELARQASDGGYASGTEFLENTRLGDYVHRQMAEGNFEPIAKYMLIEQLSFAFDDEHQSTKCPAPPKVTSFEKVRRQLLEAPAGTVAQTTVGILLSVERLAAVACFRSNQ